MEIEIVQNKSQLKDFINLPYSIYKNDSHWVPQLKKDEFALLSTRSHPFWQTARRQLYIAKRSGAPVGRIAAIIDKKYNDYAGVNAGGFGFFECENNQDTAHLLLDCAREWLVQNNMSFMRGPLNPSTNYTCGLLVSGFEHPPALMMPWNYSYYPVLLESWRLRKEQDMFAYLINRDNLTLPKWVIEELKRIKIDAQFTFRNSSKKTLTEDVHTMLRIYKESWANNWGFSPLSRDEADYLVKELTAILDPDFFVLFFHKGRPAAGMVALPDLNPLLKVLNGKLGLSAIWHFFRLRRRLRQGYRIMLFGILPQYRMMGLPMLLLDHMLELARARPDFKWVEGSWVLEDNAAIDELIEDFGGILTKRYRIYRREIAPC